MTAAFYNLLLLLLLPLAAVLTAVRHLKRRRLREDWRERLGFLPAELVGQCQGREVIWVHAVSVGETNAAKPLLLELRRRRPRAVILLSQITETGRETALAAEADGRFYLPLDLPPVIRRVLAQLRPKLLVTVDTELWPNLFWVAHERGVKVAVVNGRISDRSKRRIDALRAGWLYRWTLRQADRLLMQSPLDAQRALDLGADPATVEMTGNLKCDEHHPPVDPARLAEWQALLGIDSDSPVLLAGSTGPGEEAILLDAFQQIRAAQPTARLVMVPRAVDRAGEIAELVRAAGFTPLRRSSLPAKSDESRRTGAVVIVDTIGELAELYAVGTVAFVGRSLLPIGGSNVLQSAAQGKPTLTGPYVNNVRDSVAMLVEAGVAWYVHDASEVAAETLRLLADPAGLAALDQQAREVVLANRGATARTAEGLLELLDE